MHENQFAIPSQQRGTSKFKENIYIQPPHIETSPYVMNNLLDHQQAFVGRTDAMGEVFRLLSSPIDHILGFYGQRLIGKSSLLQELVLSLPKMGAYYPIYVELQDKDNLHVLDLYDSLTTSLATEFDLYLPLSKMIHKNKMTVDIFYEQFLPCVLQSLPHNQSLVLLFDTPFSYTKLLLEAPPRITEGLANSQMSNQDEQPVIGIPFLRFLSDLSESNQQTKIIFTVKEHYINGEGFWLSQQICWYYLTFLRAQEIKQLVRLAKQKTNLNWSKEAIKCVQEFTGGHPFLAQQLCQVIWQRAHRKPRTRLSSAVMIQPLDVEAALFETLEKINVPLSSWWKDLSYHEQAILAALAEGEKALISLKELNNRLLKEGINIEERLSQTIKVLLAADLIHSVKSDYGLTVDLQHRWIAEHNPLKYISQKGQEARLITYKFGPSTNNGLHETVNETTSPQKLLNQAISQTDSILIQQLKSKSLSGWNPLHHLGLLWSVLVEPQDYSIYQANFGSEHLYQLGKWSASTLIWLPLFIPSLALATEALPRPMPASLNDFSLTVSLFIAWLLTGYFGDRQDDVPAIVGVIASGLIASTVMLGLTGGLMSALAGCLALGIAFGMSTRLALAIAFSVTDRLGSAVALGMVGGSIFGAIANVILGLGEEMAIGITIGVALIALFISVGSMLLRLNREANQGLTFLLGMIGFSLLLLSHIFLLYYSFFGGWQLFT